MPKQKLKRKVEVALESLVKKGLARKVMIDGKPVYGMTIEGLQEVIIHSHSPPQLEDNKSQHGKRLEESNAS